MTHWESLGFTISASDIECIRVIGDPIYSEDVIKDLVENSEQLPEGFNDIVNDNFWGLI